MPDSFSYRIDLYQRLRSRLSEILDDADALARSLAIPETRRGRIGASGATSANPGRPHREVLEAIEKSAMSSRPMVELGDELRRVVKSVYGDAYDGVLVSNSESALGIAFGTLIVPPQAGAGEPYRTRYLVPYERHLEHHGSYGRPYPARYRDIFADRGATSGELGLAGRRQPFTDAVIVKLPGARYDVHGIRQYVCPLLLDVDAEQSATALARAAALQATSLGGFVSLAYDTPGYGYGTRDADGTPLLQRRIGELARQHDVPYIADDASGMPFLGTDLRRTGADVTFFSMDKVAGGPCGSLVVGREEAMGGIRRALGQHGERFGTASSYGKGGFVAADPGREALAGSLAALRLLRDHPERVTTPIETLHAIVLEAHTRFADELGPGIVISRSLNAGGVEINYQRSWAGSEFGIPIFSHEDRIAGSNVFGLILARLGVQPGLADDGNIMLTPGLGTLDDSGLREDAARDVARATFAALGLLRRWGSKVIS